MYIIITFIVKMCLNIRVLGVLTENDIKYNVKLLVWKLTALGTPESPEPHLGDPWIKTYVKYGSTKM